MKKPSIGFIGQGFVGKNYADNFESRGFKVVRYSLEERYRHHKAAIASCDIVFIAVPTPTTPKGFDSSIVESSLALVKAGKVAVIKSTVLPGTTKRLQQKYPKITVLFSPEFLSVATAAHDVENPFATIVGLPEKSAAHRAAAKLAHRVLPPAPFSLTCTSEEAEIFKYTHNLSGYTQILFFNLMYDLAQQFDCDWGTISGAVDADPFIPTRYAQPIHKSGRGAGGGCFIKDMGAASHLYARLLPQDAAGIALLRALEKKNIALLTESGKDLDLLAGVYGHRATKSPRKRPSRAKAASKRSGRKRSA